MQSVMLAPHNGKTVIVVVFHDDALTRIQNHDPAIVEGTFVAGLLVKGQFLGDDVNLQTTDFMFCYEPDARAFEAQCRKLGDQRAILQWLGRNWENKQSERDSKITHVTINKGDTAENKLHDFSSDYNGGDADE